MGLGALVAVGQFRQALCSSMECAAGRGVWADYSGGLLDRHRCATIDAPAGGVRARALEFGPVSLGVSPGVGARPAHRPKSRSGKSIKGTVRSVSSKIGSDPASFVGDAQNPTIICCS